MCKLSQDLYMRICAFVRTMADTCNQCLRPKSVCSECDLHMSSILIRELEETTRPVNEQRLRKVTPSFKTRCDFYLAKISTADGWVTAREIDPTNSLCGRGLKYWTLRKMVKMGLLKTYNEGKTVYFTLPNKETKK